MYLLSIDWSALFANIGQFILAFSILVVLHEMGHFLPAKWFGCRVDKFYLFFDPYFSLWKKKIGETQYGIGWVPLGGYVKIAGMIDESMDKEQLKKPAEPWEFRSKPAWQRLIIMLGGVTVNFVLALIIFSAILFVWGKEKLPVANLKYGLYADSLAQPLGIKNGDVITAVNGKPLVYLDDITKQIGLSDNLSFTVKRGEKDTVIRAPKGFVEKFSDERGEGFVYTRDLVVVDKIDSSRVKFVSGTLQKDDRIVGINGTPVTYFDEFEAAKKPLKNQTVVLNLIRNGKDSAQTTVRLDSAASVGFIPKPTLQTEKIKYSFLGAIPAGINYGVTTLKDYIKGLGLLFTSKEHKVNKQLGGILSIGKTFGGSWNWRRFWTLTAVFSIILAFMNILPIPALDGGHALFTLYEMITGRKPSDKFMEYAQVVGMVILLGLMLYAFGLDIWRLFK